MKCYYEELGVAPDANDGEIKTAYKKLALRWHPDKNPDNLEEAKEGFQALQQAYEVLSDQHVREWYDNHREQILRGKHSDYGNKSLDLFQYFTVSCFRGYGDDSKGFYKTFADVFEKIAAEDAEFMDDEEEIEEIPKFGDSTSSYKDVVGPFYAYWQSYCTKKTYTWLCPYDITEIKDRRVLRKIAKDMKKVVREAKKERNMEVRNLVSFIRKRDKRVQANKKLLEEKATLNRQKQVQNRLEQILKRNKEVEEMRNANANSFNDGYEEQLRELAQELNELTNDLHFDDDNEMQYVDVLYCVACNRAFTKDNTFMNHESSKKHRDNIERLMREIPDEEKSSENNVNPEEENNLEALDIEKEEEVLTNKKSNRKKKKKGKKSLNAVPAVEEEAEAHVEINELKTNPKEVDESYDEWEKGKKPAKKAKNKKSPMKPTTEEPKLIPSQPTKVEMPSEKLPNNIIYSDAPLLDTRHICLYIWLYNLLTETR